MANIYTHTPIAVILGSTVPTRIQNIPSIRSATVFSVAPETGIASPPVAPLFVSPAMTNASVAVLVTLVVGSSAATTIVWGPDSNGVGTV